MRYLNVGIELVSPPLKGEKGFETIRKICAILHKFNVKINKSCGLHVHVGVDGKDVEFFRRLFTLYATYEGRH